MYPTPPERSLVHFKQEERGGLALQGRHCDRWRRHALQPKFGSVHCNTLVYMHECIQYIQIIILEVYQSFSDVFLIINTLDVLRTKLNCIIMIVFMTDWNISVIKVFVNCLKGGGQTTLATGLH